MLLVSLAPVTILGMFAYSSAYSNLLDSYTVQAEISLSIIRENLNELACSMETAARQVIADERIIDLLNNSQGYQDRESIDVFTRREIEAALDRAIDSLRFSVTVALYSEWGFLYTYSNQATSSGGPYIDGKLAFDGKADGWYAETVNARGKELYYLNNVFSGPGRDRFATMTKLLRDPVTMESCGILLMFIRIDEITGIVPSTLINGGVSYVVKSDERCLVIGEGWGDEVLEEHLREEYLGYTRNPRTGWTVAYVLNREALLTENERILFFTAATAIVMLAVSVMLSVYASRSITRQLTLLGDAISEMEVSGRITPRDFNDDEVGTIGRHFMKMAEANERLQKKLMKLSAMEKEAEFRALQTQINPHFLYNTLPSIYWLCKLQQPDRAANVAILLADNFRYVLSRSGDEVTVREEIQNIKSYIAIQNIRYKDRIQAQYQIDPAIEERRILKLLLQPMVENAIFHGLEPKLGDWLIRIEGKQMDGSMRFDIIDNGIGINMDSFVKGFGIHNVSERIRLRYGDGSGLSVSSSPGKETRITICIPIMKERVEDESVDRR